MGLVMDGIASWQRETLAVAVEGFCRTHAESQYMEEVLSRSGQFTRGGSTGGEVATPLLAVADQMVSFFCFQRSDLMGKNRALARSYDVSGFADTSFWRTLFFRLLRDRVDSLFTAYCAAGDPDGDAKRRQRELDAEAFVEVLTQGLHGDMHQALDQPDVSSVENFFRAAGSLCLSGDHRRVVAQSKSKGEATDEVHPDAIDVDMDMMNLMSMDMEDLELTEFEEELPLEEIGHGAPVTATTTTTVEPKLDKSSDPREEGTPAAVSPSLSSIEEVVRWSLEQVRTLPKRGSPDTVLSDEQAVSAATDPLRRTCVLRLLASLKKELQFMLNASVHMMHQVSGGTECGDDINEQSLFDLLGIERSDRGLLWLVGQVILAIKLRSNSVFRADYAAGGLIQMEANALIGSLNSALSRKQVGVWHDEERRRINRIRTTIRSKFLSHPHLLAPCPLRIRDDVHLAQINEWTQANRNFLVVRARTPTGEVFTGMAANTFLTPRSPFFMEHISPYLAITQIFGTANDRELSRFFPHMHTFARSCFDEVREEGTAQNGYDRFHAKMVSHYGDKFNVHESVSLWVSMTLDEHFCNLERANELLTAQLSSVPDASLVREVLETEFRWHTDPAAFLDAYFREQGPSRPVLTLEEFLLYLGDSLTEEERALAAEVHAEGTAEAKDMLQKWT